MNKAETLLAAARKRYEERREEDAFSNDAARVRGWEPQPTMKMVLQFRPDRTLSMYKTAQTSLNKDIGAKSERISEFRTY